MNVIPLLLLCSLALVAASVVLFVISARQGDCQQAERMCLMPLEEDAVAADGAPHDPEASQDNGVRDVQCQ